MNELPQGCFEHVNYERIIAKDIRRNRMKFAGRVRNYSTERAIKHDLLVKKMWRLFKPSYWSVFSATTYEMWGNDGWGGYSWSETDLTGLEWKFHNKEDAYHFVDENIA